MTQQITRTYFDYNALPDKNTRAVLRQEATAIKAAVKRTHDNIIEIGNRLIHAKEVAGHGNFMEWIDAEFGMGQTMAWNFMRVAETFGKFSLNENLGLSQTALFMLASPSVSDETRGVAIELTQSGDLKTTADAKAIIDAAKPPTPEPIAPSVPSPDDDDDFDDSDPFDDIDLQPEIGNFEPEADAEFNPGGLYDSDEDLPVIEVPDHSLVTTEILTVDDEIDALPLARALSLYPHRGQIFKQQANLWHTCSSVIKAARAKGSHFRYTNERGPVTMALKAIASLPSPDKWLGCGTCKGSLRFGENRDPCESCGGVGFTVHENQGVTAEDVTFYAEEFNAQSIAV